MNKRSIIVLNIFFMVVIFFSHWFILWQIMTGILETTWYLANYNLLVFNWVDRISVLDFSPLLIVLMILINILLYIKEKQ